MNPLDQRLRAFPVFNKTACAAMDFHVDTPPGARIEQLAPFGRGEPHGDEGPHSTTC